MGQVGQAPESEGRELLAAMTTLSMPLQV
jgi:hypothetical protein